MKKVELFPRYKTPLLGLYDSKLVHYRLKREVTAFTEWLNKTYPIRYKDIKEGDCFILWNGEGFPVPFIQLQDERPDKRNRPTRLLDGCYLSLDAEARVRLSNKDELVALKKEIQNYHNQ